MTLKALWLAKREMEQQARAVKRAEDARRLSDAMDAAHPGWDFGWDGRG